MDASLVGQENEGEPVVLQETVKQRLIKKRMKDIYRRIREQMEFYFSDYNLQKDAYLSNIIKQSDEGYVELSEFMKFNKVKELTSRTIDIAKALRSSQLFEVSEDHLNIRRITPIKAVRHVDERTIYVENIPSHADHNWFKDVFKSFGNVVYISVPKYAASGLIKGFAFVEFDAVESAESAVKYYSIPNPADLCDVTKNLEETKEEDQCSDQKRKGIKREIEEAQEEKSELQSKKVKCSEDEAKPNAGALVPGSTEKNPAKKNRKRKKKHKEKREPETLRLTVMTKVVWKRFKERYQNLQKQKMSEVKNSLKLLKASNPSAEKMQSEMESDPKCPSRDPEFIAGVIIRLNLSQAVGETCVKEMKKKFKTIDHVRYVDIKEGRPSIYIRCTDADNAKLVMSKVSEDGDAVVLEDEGEKEYWKQIVADRANKLNTQTRVKIRGSQKIMAKVLQTAEKGNSHIHFDN